MLQFGDQTLIRGDLNYAGRDLINNIKVIYQRALTTVEAAEKARSIEIKLLAQGISRYVNGLKDRIEDKSDSASPYRGLLEYRLADSDRFFGRDEAKQQIAKILSRSSFSVLHAESGAGKTSLLQAGIMPAILASGHLPIYLRRYGYDHNPAEAIKRTLLSDSESTTWLMKESLADFLRKVTTILDSATCVFLILDQFEGFFDRLQEADQKSFIADVSECVNNPSLNVRWLFCLRNEYFGKLASFRPDIPDPFENAYYLQSLSRVNAEKAIEKPARLQKLTFEKGLIPELLDDLGKEKIQPPHMQLVCSALVENLKEKQKIFTHTEYIALGKAQGILKNHLERVLTEKVPKNRTTLCRQVLEGLITSTQHRALRTEQELITALRIYPEDEIRDAISLLASNRLLRGEETDHGPAYELAHDYLLDEIKLSPEVIKTKQAREILDQGTATWRRHNKLPFTPDMLTIIEGEKGNLDVTAEEIGLILLSATSQIRVFRQWIDSFQHTALRDAINYLIKYRENNKENKRRIDKVLWSSRKLVPESIGRKFRLNYFIRYQALYFFLILIAFVALLPLGKEKIEDMTWASPGLQKINSVETQCLEGPSPGKLMVATDPFRYARVAVYSSETNSLCVSRDSGSSWKRFTLDTQVKSINEITVSGDSIYLRSENGVFEVDTRNGALNYYEVKIEAVASLHQHQKDVLIVKDRNQVLIGRFEGNTWKEINSQDITGKIIALEASWNNIVALTESGSLWITKIGEYQWREIQIDPLPDGWRPVRISTLSRLPNVGIDKGLTIYITNQDHLIYNGYISLENLAAQVDEPIAIHPGQYQVEQTELTVYAATDDGLYCDGTWNVLQWEWWRWKLIERLEISSPYLQMPCS